MSLEDVSNLYDVFKEVYAVLSLTDTEIVEKIPDNIFQNILEYASQSNIEPEVDTNLDLSEQKISNESKSFLSILWYKYMCTEEDKAEITKKWATSD